MIIWLMSCDFEGSGPSFAAALGRDDAGLAIGLVLREGIMMALMAGKD